VPEVGVWGAIRSMKADLSPLTGLPYFTILQFRNTPNCTVVSLCHHSVITRLAFQEARCGAIETTSARHT